MICVFITDVVIATLALTFVCVFIFGTKYWHFLDSYIEHKTPQELQQVESNVVLILIPNICVLFLKLYYGSRWLKRSRTRPAFQTYYMVSWSFYTSFFVQEIMIIIFSWNVFIYEIRYAQLVSLLSCIIMFNLMRINMSFMDKQNQGINLIRKEAAETRRRETELSQRYARRSTTSDL